MNTVQYNQSTKTNIRASAECGLDGNPPRRAALLLPGDVRPVITFLFTHLMAGNGALDSIESITAGNKQLKDEAIKRFASFSRSTSIWYQLVSLQKVE